MTSRWKIYLTGAMFLLFQAAFQSSTIAWVHGVGVTLIGTLTAGNVVVGAGSTSIQDSSALASSPGYATLPAGLSLSKNIVYAGASNAVNSWLYTQSNISGSPTIGVDGLISPLHFLIAHDTATSTVDIFGLTVKLQPDTGHTGGRSAIVGYNSVIGVPGAGSNNLSYAALQGYVTTAQNLGGTTGVFTNYKGALFGGNSNVFTASGATFLKLVTSWEFDTSVVSGSSAGRKDGLLIVQGATDAVRGTFEDGAIVIASQAASTTWLNGLLFGSYSSQWPFGADSTLIGAMQRVLPSPDSPIALNGVDFSAVAFQAGGCAYKSTGFCVDPNGILILSGTTTGTPVASLCLDSGNNVIKVAGANCF